MKIKLPAIFILLFVLLVNSCKTTTVPDNSRSSLDWDGIYSGILPCADCEGIFTSIQLKKDLSYTLKSKYMGKSDSVFESRGKFTWNDKGSNITLDDKSGAPSMYKVGENKLIKLDFDGNEIKGNLSDKYLLMKVYPGIAEKYWKLIELNGKPIPADQKFNREPHFILKSEGNRVIGHGGCNSFGGSYELKEGDRITFSQIVATRMACPNMEVEDQFFQVLNSADNYNLNGDTLVLNKARMAPLARFEAVYLK